MIEDFEKHVIRDKDLKNFDIKYSTTGHRDKDVTNSLYGLNYTGVETKLLNDRDGWSMTFFTRPQLKLTDDNLILIRKLHPLLSQDENSIFRYVRMILDPRLGYNMSSQPNNNYKQLKSDLVDNNQAFIPILTNTIKSISGWPDTILPTHTSKEGLKREQQSIGDGALDIFNSFDLDVTFRNTAEEPHSILFTTWTKYISEVFEGNLTPYLDMITENEIDYNTRIYKVIFGFGNTKIKKIAMTGASFPISVPTGKYFDESEGSPLSMQNKDINIRFKCDGAMYNEQIIMGWFNRTVCTFNPLMEKVLKGESGHGMKMIPHTLAFQMNHRAYPLINRSNNEMTWWINEEYLKRITDV